MDASQRARARRLADELDQRMLEDCTHPAADLLRELAAEPSPWPEGLRDRIESAIERINNRHAPRRIPADPTDVDLVLAEVRALMDGKDPPFWLKRAIAAEPVRVPMTDEKFEEFIEQFRWYDGDVDRYDIQGFARELLRAHGIV